MTADFEYYTIEYNGAVIPTEEAFNSVLVDALAFVDASVSHRELLTYDKVARAYKNAICGIAEGLYDERTTGGRKSESVGNHSVTYASKTTAERQMRKHATVRMYLANTGLLYRG